MISRAYVNPAFNPFYSRNCDQMKCYLTAGFALFAKIKTIFMDRNTALYRNAVQQPLKIQSGHFHTYCISISLCIKSVGITYIST